MEKANSWAGVLGTSLAIVGMIVTILTSWWRQHAAAAAPVTPEVLAQAAEVLASRVAEQWQREAEARSLDDPDPMPVRWTLSDDALMDHEEHIAPAPVVFAGCSDRMPELVGEFRKLHRRRLVIVGGPGTGKTTLAVQLVLALLADPRPGDPVPVLLSMVSWDPDAQPRVQDWLTNQLDQTYPALSAFGRDAARRLVEQGRVLPGLDGLDELPEQRRPRVITALNTSLPRDGGVILTSRITEYTSAVGASRVLTAAAVVRPEPLTHGEVADYLAARLPRQPDPSWQKVLVALRAGTAGALSTVAETPLGLWLLRTVHIDARQAPERLIDTDQYPNPRSIQTHLLAELIPAVLRSRPPRADDEDPLRPKRSHDPDDVRRWLTSLAIELRDAGSRDWRWWHLARHTFTRRQFGQAVWQVAGLAAWLVVGLAAWLAAWLAVGLAVGLVGGLALGLAVGLRGELTAEPVKTSWRIRGRGKELLSKLVVGLVVGLIGGLAVGLMVGLVVGLVVGLALELRGGLNAFSTSVDAEQRATSPVTSVRNARRHQAAIGLMGFLTSVLVTGLVGGMPGDLRGGLAYGWVCGLAVGLITTFDSASTTFHLAAGLRAAQRRLPWRIMGFLDDAYRLGLLRVVGPVYQFRHAELQDHLAPPHPSPAVVAADPVTSS